MRKIIFISIFFLLLLTMGCQMRAERKDQETVKHYSQFSVQIPIEKGFYYQDNKSFLHFYDYHAKQSVMVCNRPNCRHQSWSEEIPVEERCHAYLGDAVPGFVLEEKLYLFFKNVEKRKITLVSSELDRSNQKEICSWNGSMVVSYALKAPYVYVCVTENEMEKEKSGAFVLGKKTKSNVLKIDVRSGKKEELIPAFTGYNTNLRIIGASKDEIYFSNHYFKKEFDGTNFEEADLQMEYYIYRIETQSWSELFPELVGKDIVGIERNEDEYLLMMYSDQEGKALGQNKLVRYTEGKETKTIVESDQMIKVGNYYLCKDKNEYFLYNPREETTQKLLNFSLNNRNIRFAENGYIFYSKQESDGVKNYIIKEKDFYDQKEEGIYIPK